MHEFPHAVIDRELPASGERLPPDWALQDPEDYLEVLREAVPAALRGGGRRRRRRHRHRDRLHRLDAAAGARRRHAAVPRSTSFRERPHAYPKLWKHHAAQEQADRINALAEERGEPWLPRYGGRISSEWQFAKALQVLEEDPEVYERMERWVEGADWIVWQLSGEETRNLCTAGYKAIYQDGAFPDRDFLARARRALRRLRRGEARGPAARRARLARRRPHGAGGRVDRAARGHRGRRRATSTRT